ncbi:unnamed protein product, partial [Iphiclides podalirius]
MALPLMLINRATAAKWQHVNGRGKIDRAECAGPLWRHTAGGSHPSATNAFRPASRRLSVRDLRYLPGGGNVTDGLAALNDVMSRLSWRPVLWALAVLSTLAPSRADGNIGCLFSATLCIEGVEWCYDDFAFGKCIPIYESDPEDGSLYQYDMSSQQLQWFEGELQRLATQGYRWEHAYTQCVLQAMLYALRHNVEPGNVNSKLCDHFTDPKLNTATSEIEDGITDMEPDETAFVHFTPNSALSDYANEFYNPPISPDDDPTSYIIPKDKSDTEDGNPNDEIRNLMLMNGLEESPAIMPFGGFRERLQAEQEAKEQDGKYFNALEKEKKSLPDANRDGDSEKYADEERLGAHFRKLKTKPYPFTAEYLTSHYSPLDAEVHSNALEKYKQSFAEKNFPFEYENPSDFQEPRIYIDTDDLDEMPTDVGSGKYDPYTLKDTNPSGFDGKNSENMRYILNYWRRLKDQKSQQPIYAEGGPLKPEDLEAPSSPDQKANSIGHDHNDYDSDPSYAYVLFKNRFLTDWEKGLAFISRLEEMLD